MPITLTFSCKKKTAAETSEHYVPASSDRASGPCAGWSMPSRIPPYPLPPARPAVETPVSRVPGGTSWVHMFFSFHFLF
jgi:hypothetical protein